MSQRTSALTVQEVNEQNKVTDTGINFGTAQDRPATIKEYSLTNDPHRDFDNMEGQTNVYSMSATTTTAMRLAARMLKHGLRDGDVNNPVDVAETADEIQNTMSEGEARDKADILKEMDDKNDNEIREIEREIHDDKDHEKMDDKDIHDDEKHLDRLKKSRRHRKAGFLSPDNYLDADTQSQLENFLIMPVSWAASLNYWDMIPYLTENQLQQIDDPTDLRGSIIDFVTTIDPNAIIDLQDKVLPFLDTFLAEKEAASLTASHHYRKADIYTPNFPYMTEEEERQVDNFTFYAHERANVFNYLASIPTMSEEQLNNIENLDDLHFAILRFLTRLNDPNVVNTLQNGAIVTLREYEDNSPAIKISHHHMRRHTAHALVPDNLPHGPRNTLVEFFMDAEPNNVDVSNYLDFDAGLRYLASIPDYTDQQLATISDPDRLQGIIASLLSFYYDDDAIPTNIDIIRNQTLPLLEDLANGSHTARRHAHHRSMIRKARKRYSSHHHMRRHTAHALVPDNLPQSTEYAAEGIMDDYGEEGSYPDFALFVNYLASIPDYTDQQLATISDPQGLLVIANDFLNWFDADNVPMLMATISNETQPIVNELAAKGWKTSHRSHHRHSSRHRYADFDVIPDIDAGTMDEFIENADDLGELLYTISDLSMEELKKLDDNDQMDLQDAINSFTRHVTRRTLDGLDSVENRLAYINGEDRSSDPWREAFGSHRKASFNDLGLDRRYLDDFLKDSEEWATVLDTISNLTEDQLNTLDNDEILDLQAAIDTFLNTLGTNYDIVEGIRSVLDDIYYTHENLFTASRHSHHSRRYAAADEHTVCDVRMTKDGDYEARCDGKVKRFDKKGDALEWLSDHFTDSYQDKPEFHVKHDESRRARRRYAEEDEKTVCDVRKTKDGDYEARCDGKVKRFDKKGDALEWLYDHFTDSYKDEPEFTDKDKKAARLQKLIAAHRKQIMSSKAPRQIERTPSVRMASTMSPSKTDISSILL